VFGAGIVPHVPESPGSVHWAGPRIGQHTESLLGDLLGINADEINALRREGAVEWLSSMLSSAATPHSSNTTSRVPSRAAARAPLTPIRETGPGGRIELGRGSNMGYSSR
jgi:hypothetical protein